MFSVENTSDNVNFKFNEDIINTAVTIYDWVMYTVLCQALSIFGIATNIINVICFAEQGLKDAVTINLFALSISDMCSLITMVWSCISLTPAFVTADLPFDSIGVCYLVSGIPHFTFTRVSGFITAMVTVERCLSVTMPLKVKDIITPKRTTVIVISFFVMFTFSAAPFYTVNSLGLQYSPLKNKTVVGIMYRRNREQVENIAISVNNFFFPMCAFVIIAVSTFILANQMRNQSKWRQSTIKQVQADRIWRRNKWVAKMVVTVSTLFISCYTPIVITMMTLAFVPELSFYGKYFYISKTLGGIIYTLESINSSMNVFIYFKMSTKYRNTFRKLFFINKLLIIVE